MHPHIIIVFGIGKREKGVTTINKITNLNMDNRLNLFGIIFGLRINVACWNIDGTDIFNVFILNGRHRKEFETRKVLFEFKVYKYTYLENPKQFWLLTIGNKAWKSGKDD